MKHILLSAFIAFAGTTWATEAHRRYEGFETRAITSLSASDIAALEQGKGWGLALPAELNG